jgi:hypothetical protein
MRLNHAHITTQHYSHIIHPFVLYDVLLYHYCGLDIVLLFYGINHLCQLPVCLCLLFVFGDVVAYTPLCIVVHLYVYYDHNS